MKYPYLPLRDFTILPEQKATLFFGRKKSIIALEHAIEENSLVVLSAQKNPKTNSPKIEDIYVTGTLSEIEQIVKLTDGTFKAVLCGKKPFNITKLIEKEAYFVEGKTVNDVFKWESRKTEVEAIMRNIITGFQQYAKLNSNVNIEDVINIISTGDPFKLCYGVMSQLNVKVKEKQKLLESNNILEKLEIVYSALIGEIEILEIDKKIKEKVRNQISRNQKEYYLNEQLNAIQNELGYKSDPKSELIELENKFKDLDLPEYVREKVDNELKKLKSMHPASGETSIVRNYLEWIADIPWNKFTEDENDLNKVEEILNNDHFGLEKVKDRITEYIAVKILSKSNNSPILCFVGPPGVGKTSLGKSIARALKRKFVRMSLGGVKDEAEIRGHRRTYIGSLPGKIIQGMKKAGSSNPVFLLDEIDKISSDYRGDPSSALLEVLDPEQNHTFNDHYLGMDYDLSNVLFLATANSLETIPHPLRDRMEIIKIEGYTEYEKVEIAKQYLLPNLLKDTGLIEHINVKFSEGGFLKIIREYTREAGVRNLKRETEKILRKIAKKVVKGEIDTDNKLIGKNNIEKFLGVPKFKNSQNQNKSKIGVTNGLAWTQAGGDTLTIEVSIMKGSGNVVITGKLGEVMQESAKAALTYVRTRAEVLGLVDDFYKLIDFHIHVPEGAIPKDGPSAGITIATSLVSAVTGIPVKGDVAMTGEITLRGEILPIGGLKEKLLAAKRAGITTVILPEKNENELKEIPERILSGLNIIQLNNMDDVLINSLEITEETKKRFRKEFRSIYYSKKINRSIIKDFQNITMLKH